MAVTEQNRISIKRQFICLVTTTVILKATQTTNDKDSHRYPQQDHKWPSRSEKQCKIFILFISVLTQYVQTGFEMPVGGLKSHYWSEWAKLTSKKHLIADTTGIKIEISRIAF